MKICYATNFLPNYHKTWAGAEVACYRLVMLLVNNNRHVTVLATEPYKEPEEDFDFYSIRILSDYRTSPLRIIGSLLKSCLSFDPVSYISSYNVLKRLKPDLLHLHNFDVLSFSLVSSAKRLGIPVLFSVYDNWCLCPRRTLVNNKNEICKKYHGTHCINCISCDSWRELPKKDSVVFRKELFNYFLSQIDTFIVLTNSWAEMLRQYGIKSEKIEVVPLPLFEEVDDSRVNAVEEHSILFVGWVNPHKGLHILIEAMPEILKEIPEAKLYVIESGQDENYKKKIISSIEKFKISNHVFFLGRKPNQEVRAFLQRADVVVVPEQWGIAWPIFLTEAMAFAKPIVASQIGDIPFFIKDGESGFLANPKDPSDFAKKVIWMFKNTGSAVTMGENARKNVTKLCDENAILEKLFNLYKSLQKE